MPQRRLESTALSTAPRRPLSLGRTTTKGNSDEMNTTDAADLIKDLQEDRAEQASADKFRDRAALFIALLAAILAIGGLGGGNATDDLIGYNIRAADAWSFYQAKNARQTIYEVAADGLQAQLADPALPQATRAALTERLADYRRTIDRYESEPDRDAPNDPLRGEGKRQLMAQAKAHEAARDRATAQDANFDLAEVALQLALVLGSVAILAVNRGILMLSAALGLAGTLLTANGFFLLVPVGI